MATSNGTGIIQSLGIGSGLDIKSLVTQLVNAERAPSAARITRQATRVGATLSAMGSLKGALSGLQSALQGLRKPDQFQAMDAASSDPDVLTATASAGAATGVLAVRVQQLAQAEQLKSAVFTSGAGAVVGTGALSIAMGGSSFSLQIGSNNNTLAGIRDAINGASDNVGVRASLVYGQTGAQLILTSQQSGAGKSITVGAVGGDGGLGRLTWDGSTGANYTVATAAQDSIVTVAGVEHHDSRNVIDGAIDGVTLNLVAARPDADIQVTVSANRTSVAANVQKFVDGYNELRKVINKLASYDSITKTGGPLLGDSMLNGIENQIRRLTTDPVGGVNAQVNSLAAIGVTTDNAGLLKVDGGKLDAAIKSSGSAVAQLFAAGAGLAPRLDAELTRILGSGGVVAARDANLSSAQKAITDQQAFLDQRMAVIEQRYLAQFTALDRMMSQLNSTSNYLTQQLTQISNIGK